MLDGALALLGLRCPFRFGFCRYQHDAYECPFRFGISLVGFSMKCVSIKKRPIRVTIRL